MKTKTMQIELKAIDLDEGQFEGYAAVFGNKDSYGDILVQGAFAESLAKFGENGAGVPTYWCHDFKDPFKNLGSTIWAKEDSHGLRVRVQLDLETHNARQTLKLLKEGRVNQMSFGYTVLEGAYVESEEHGYFYEIRKVELHEVSVVPIGANQETEILAAKADDGLVSLLKSATEAMELARGAFMKAADIAATKLPALPGGDEESESDSGEERSEVKPEEPETAKGEEPSEAKARNADEALALIALASAGVNIEEKGLESEHSD